MRKSSLDFFLKNGYSVIKLFSNEDIKILLNSTNQRLNKILGKKLNIDNLKNYHKHDVSDIDHNIMMNPHSRYIRFDKNIINKIKKNKELTKILNGFWDNNKFEIIWGSSTLYNKTLKNASGFRVARPKKKHTKDVAGVHIDLHFGGEIRKSKKAMLTVWTPLIGFSDKYSLRLAPKSHNTNWPSSSISKQKKYITPVFKKNYKFPFKFIRPNLKKGEVIIFHPNLLHGGSSNIGNVSRVSLDFRIFNSEISEL